MGCSELVEASVEANALALLRTFSEDGMSRKAKANVDMDSPILHSILRPIIHHLHRARIFYYQINHATKRNWTKYRGGTTAPAAEGICTANLSRDHKSREQERGDEPGFLCCESAFI
jgi:hypothetical protein